MSEPGKWNYGRFSSPSRPFFDYFRGKDFLKLVDEALTLKKRFNEPIPRIMPENTNVQGLFIEFMIVRHSLDEYVFVFTVYT